MRRRIPSTQALLAFEAAARTRSFTLAAQELALTQSAVSHHVIGLEDSLGVELFVRLPRRLELTEAGTAFLAQVARGLDAIEAGVLELVSTGGRGGVLELAVVPTLATKWLIPRLPQFLKAHPGLTLNLSTRLVPFDFSGTPLDAALHYGEPRWPGARCDYLMGEECVVVCSPALAMQAPLAQPADVLRHTLLHQSTRPQAWGDWLQQSGVETAGMPRGPRFELFSMVTQAAIAGLGLAVVPRFLVDEELADGRLMMPFQQALRSSFAYHLVYPESRAGFRPLRQFRHWLLDQAHPGAGHPG